MVQLSADQDFHFEILRDLAAAAYGGADMGETLTAAAQVVPMNFESYYAAFYKMAMRVNERAKNSDRQSFPVSARDAFFHASTYFRSADFYLHGNWSDPRINTLWSQQKDAFDAGLALLPVPGKRVTVNTTSFAIPTVWYPAAKDCQRRPTLIVGGGYDGGQEELYHQMGNAGTDRGWNVITYEGPGQATPRREQDLGFIFDWEKVVTPIVDYLHTRPDVDTDAIALVGLSFGGYLAPRAAAFEHRLAAVVALDGLYDFGSTVLNELGAPLISLFNSGNKTTFDKVMNGLRTNTSAPTQTRWAIDQGLWSFNTPSPYDWISGLQKYTLKDVVGNITMPILSADGQDDQFFHGQGKVLADHVGSTATYHLFETADGAGEHAGIGASVQQNQVVFDWLARTIGVEKLKPNGQS